MEKSVITIATGSYVNEAIHLIETIRENGGEAKNTHAFIFTDKKVDVPEHTSVCIIDTPVRRGSMRFAHRTFKAHLYADLPAEKAIFVDSDVECFGDFSYMFETYCDPNKQYGAPDGKNPNPNDMIKNFVFNKAPNKDEAMKMAEITFGKEYLESDKPFAWNVGVLPMHRNIGNRVGPIILEIFDKIESFDDKHFKYYTSNFDEQVPLNYALWKEQIPTFDMDRKYNTTKSMIKSKVIKDLSDIVFLHLRHWSPKGSGTSGNRDLYKQIAKAMGK